MEMIVILGWALGTTAMFVILGNRTDKKVDTLIKEIANLYFISQEQNRRIAAIDAEIEELHSKLSYEQE